VLIAAALIDPSGRILPALFPDEDAAALDERVQGYLDTAYAMSVVSEAAEPDTAAEAYAYWRSFDAVAMRMNREAARMGFADQGDRTVLESQFKFWAAERDRARETFQWATRAVAAEGEEPSPRGAPMPSTSTALLFEF
jgi:hypothetical protein